MFSLATKFSPEAANFEKACCSGYDHAELFLTPTRLMSWRTLSKIARSYEMNYVLHFPTCSKAPHETSEEVVLLAQDINCRTISVHENCLETAMGIREIDPQLQLCVENQSVELEKLDSWIAANEFITLNVENLWKQTLQDDDFSELESVIRRLFHRHRERIRSVHLSGYRPGRESKTPLAKSAEFTNRIFDILLAENFDGIVVGEIDVQHQTSELLKADLALFHRWQNQNGLYHVPAGLFGSTPQLNNTLPQ